MFTKRHSVSICVINDEQILVAGGIDLSGNKIVQTEIFYTKNESGEEKSKGEWK